jgi:16S rRNA (uracil1498-N3)-methyltransferase
LGDPPAAGWTVVTGPEGGLAAEEVAALGRAGPVASLALGPHVLRAETAAVAAVATLVALVARGPVGPGVA